MDGSLTNSITAKTKNTNERHINVFRLVYRLVKFRSIVFRLRLDRPNALQCGGYGMDFGEMPRELEVCSSQPLLVLVKEKQFNQDNSEYKK